MTIDAVVEFAGVPGSPYTRKMLALLRYRRIPYRLYPSSRHQLASGHAELKVRPSPKVNLLPTFYFTDEAGAEYAVCDSTPIIRKFELSHKLRSVIPPGALGFINYLIEDYADEWLTKAMFHYRWSYPQDAHKAGQMLPRWNNTCADEALLQAKSDEITKLQVSRLSYVGSNQYTKKTIEDSFIRLLSILDNLLKINPFIFGKYPSSADFALYGQFTALALFDPTPQGLILKLAPRLYAWTETMDDLSGLEAEQHHWESLSCLTQSLSELLKEIGRVYAPYLIANSTAAAQGKKQFTTTIDGATWQQNTFGYQAKCLQWIREEFAKLDDDSKAQLKELSRQYDFEVLLGDG